VVCMVADHWQHLRVVALICTPPLFNTGSHAVPLLLLLLQMLIHLCRYAPRGRGRGRGYSPY
jgi:hypothetical protein